MACLTPVTAVFPFFAGRVVLPLWLPFVTFDFFCPGLVSLFRLFPPPPLALSSSSFLSLSSGSSFFSLYISLILDGKRAECIHSPYPQSHNTCWALLVFHETLIMLYAVIHMCFAMTYRIIRPPASTRTDHGRSATNRAVLPWAMVVISLHSRTH
jgi:hypothetical protein